MIFRRSIKNEIRIIETYALLHPIPCGLLSFKRSSWNIIRIFTAGFKWLREIQIINLVLAINSHQLKGFYPAILSSKDDNLKDFVTIT